MSLNRDIIESEGDTIFSEFSESYAEKPSEERILADINRKSTFKYTEVENIFIAQNSDGSYTAHATYKERS